jgi:hypothetical protein
MKFRHLPLLGLLLALVSCQTISTKDQHTVNTAFPDVAPKLIVVRDFENNNVTLKRDARETDLPQQITRLLGNDLFQGFKAANYNTQKLSTGQTAGNEGWVVTGRIQLVQWSNINDNPDDKAASDDRIECTVYVYDVSKSRVQPFLTFDVAESRLAGDAANDQGAPATDSASSLKATCDALSQIAVQRVQDYIRQNFQ